MTAEGPPTPALRRLGVVGSGLIGTSVGLAARAAGIAVLLVDQAPGRAAAAAALGAGEAAELDDLTTCEHVIVAVPPATTPVVVQAVLRRTVTSTVSDACSVKASVLQEVETLCSDVSRFCGGHPIAGRERGGPGAAQPQLFEGAVWAVTPLAATGGAATAAVVELASRCGARPVLMSPDDHDAVLAAVSHAPQLLASALAAELVHAGPLSATLAGSGFRDATRLADSDPDLWTQIALANRLALAPAMASLADRLRVLVGALDAGDALAIRSLLDAGREGRGLLPGKANAARPVWARVGVVLADRPGELARLLAAAGAADVNVEDLAIEHAPDHPVGYVDLMVDPESAERLIDVLTQQGWAAHPTG